MIKTFEQFIFEKDNNAYVKKVNFLLAGEKVISGDETII